MIERLDLTKYFEHHKNINYTEPEVIEISNMNVEDTAIKIEQGLDPLSTSDHEHENIEVKREDVDFDLV